MITSKIDTTLDGTVSASSSINFFSTSSLTSAKIACPDNLDNLLIAASL